MPFCRLHLAQQTFEHLLSIAAKAHRPPVWHGEFLLTQAIEAEFEALHESPLEPVAVAGAEQGGARAKDTSQAHGPGSYDNPDAGTP